MFSRFPRLLVGASLLALLIVCPAGIARAEGVVISEFMASNARTIVDDDGNYSDWLELCNPDSTPADLDGWYLTDSAANKTKWRIPAVTIPPGKFLLVWCSKMDRRDPAKPLHTNFKLGASGSYLGLVRPDGVTVACEYAPLYPPQQTDVSYGMAFEGTMTTFLASGASAMATVPQNGADGLNWTAIDYTPVNWSAGTTGIGYERASGYESLIGLNLGQGMYGLATSAYIRIPFTVDGVPTVDKLSLRMKYDDGFIAYLNGTRIASANAPVSAGYNASATTIHDDSLAVQFEDFDISAYKGTLRSGPNVLAIHGLNAGTNSSDFLILPELAAYSGSGILPDVRRYFSAPTPGAPNGTGTADQGPLIDGAAHTPLAPREGEGLTVTARVVPAGAALQTVSMIYRVNYGAEVAVSMVDDGQHGDGGSGDGVYGAAIPASAYTAGQMVRYFVSAVDTAGHASRYPVFSNPSADAQYLGTVVQDPGVVTSLPVLYWFVQDPAAAETDAGTVASISYNGEFYDNVHVRLRGQTSASWPKKNLKFDMTAFGAFRYDPARERVKEFNLQSTYSDKAYMRQVLAWETYRNAGVPGCLSFHLRVQQNGAFYSVAEWVEQPDETMLTRNGLDADGALYKMYNECTNAILGDNSVEKKTRKNEDASDLIALINGIQLTSTSLNRYLLDNVDLPEVVNYLAATSIMHDNDHIGKNYYLYRDSDGNGEWQILPWDKDLTFGRNFVPWDGGVLADEIWADRYPYSDALFGDSAHPKVDGPWNRFIDAVYRNPVTRRMYLRRLRTLMDTLLQPPSTPVASLLFENRIDALAIQIAPDVALDRARWGNPYGAYQEFPDAVSLMKSAYFTARRAYLFNPQPAPNTAIPASMPGRPDIRFGMMEASPASGNPDEAFLSIVNNSTYDADVSEWRLEGAISYTFRPGTVIPAKTALYVSPNVAAFRKRATAPRGGLGYFVQGDYHGRLSAIAPEIALRDATGTLVAVPPITTAETLNALRLAAGLSADTPATLARWDVAEPPGTIDLADVVGLFRSANGLN